LGQRVGKPLVRFGWRVTQHLVTAALDHPRDDVCGFGTVEFAYPAGGLTAVQEVAAVAGVALDESPTLTTTSTPAPAAASSLTFRNNHRPGAD
jgi:hypothetical protein